MTTTTTNHRDASDEATVELPRPTTPQAVALGYRPGPQWGTGFPPPPPYSPHAPFAQPAPRRGLTAISRNTRIGVAAAIALVVAMVVAVVLGAGAAGGTQARRYAPAAGDTAARLVTPAELAGMLLSPEAIAQLVGQPATAAVATPRPVHSTPNNTDVLSTPSCLPVAYPAEQVAYQGSGFTAMKVQMTVARPAKDQPQLWVFEQGAVTYPTAEAAEKFVAASADSWKTCQNQSWSQRYDTGATVFWTSGEVTAADGLLSVLTTQENGEGWGCRRGLKAHANAVMDFAVCGDNVPASVVPATAEAIAHSERPV